MLNSVLLNALHPIGKILEILNDSYDPNIELGGTWIEDTNSTVLVSQDNNFFSGNVGTIVGSAVATAAYPSHTHISKITTVFNGTSVASYGDCVKTTAYETLRANSNGYSVGGGTLTASLVGSNDTHNNMQPYQVIKRWIRTA